MTEKDIRYLSTHFQPGKKLDLRNIPSYILRDVAKVLSVYHWFGGRFLPRYLYDARLRTLVDEYFERQDSDDWNLLVAGIEHLTDQELEHECMKRNMRWFAPPSALRHQLKQWCAITQSEDVPSHILSFVRPCATSHVQMLKGLSEDEISSVMNNKKYEDAPMKKILSQLRSGIQKDKTSSTSIDVSILEEEIDDLKTRVESAKDEAAAAEEALRFVQKEFADFEEAQILGFFDAINKVHGVLRKDEVWARSHTPPQEPHQQHHNEPKTHRSVLSTSSCSRGSFSTRARRSTPTSASTPTGSSWRSVSSTSTPRTSSASLSSRASSSASVTTKRLLFVFSLLPSLLSTNSQPETDDTSLASAIRRRIGGPGVLRCF